MSLLTKLFNATNNLLYPHHKDRPASFSHLITELREIDPDKFYVENVRSLLNITHQEAVEVCKIAIKRGEVQEELEYLCDDNSVGELMINEDNEEVVLCYELDENGVYEAQEYPKQFRKSRSYFRLSEI